jgi:ABC-2 type transport system permease protein
MNFRIIKTVIAREYLTRVKKKSFLVTTIIVPVVFAAAMVALGFIMSSTKERKQSVAVVDRSGIVMSHLENTDRVSFEDFSTQNPDSLKNNLEAVGKDVLVVVSPLDTVKNTVSVQAYSKDPLGVEFSSRVSSEVNEAVEEYRVQSYGIENLSRIMDEVRSDVSLTEYTLDDDGNETVSESGVYMIVSMLLGIVIWMFIMMFGGQVMSSVIEEKTSRVVEVLISSVKAMDLMFGKIVGVALVALTQFFLWIVLTMLLVCGATAIAGEDVMKNFSASNPEMMAQTMGVSAEQMQSLTGVLPAADQAAASDQATAGGAAGESAGQAAPSEMSVVVSTLMNIPWTKLVVSFLIYFILGYLLYASMFAAVGSAVENEGDAAQLQMPITIPLVIAYFIILIAYQNPDSGVVVWGSMIPFTSPIVMLARIPYGVPMWQLVVSIALLLATFVGCAWLSAKIYKVGILMFGKKSTFKDLWKWLKMN